MEIFQKLLRRVSFGVSTSQRSRPPHRSSFNTPEQWQAYWKAQGQPWRREPEIDLLRQAELARRRAIVPDIDKGIYPFKGMKLSRADVEWLLATLDGQGPVDWNDQSQHQRPGVDLRGADLRHIDLSYLPLSRLCGGLSWTEWLAAKEQHTMAAMLMEGVNLMGAKLEGANLCEAQLVGANLSMARLNEAILPGAQLERADLRWAQMEEADLSWARLGGANLTEAQFKGADLRGIILSDEKHIGPWLADILWDGVNLSVVDWSQLILLGDECEARQNKREGEAKARATQQNEYQAAVRAYRQLAVALQGQGLNEQASRFAYRSQVLQKRVLWFQMLQSGLKLKQRLQALGFWLFSWFLYLLAGYGYKPFHSFLAYLLVISTFTALYLVLDPRLAWYEAVVVSMTAFHGRGFSPSTFSPGDPLSIASAFEAFVGLIIEVTFIATLTHRFFNR